MQTLNQLVSGNLKGITHIKLSEALTQFPSELFSLAETLEVLDLSQNRLSHLPDDFGRFSKLRIAFFSDNLFTEFPYVLKDCKQLSMIGFKSNQIKFIPENALPRTTRWLILTNNKISKLPKSIGACLLLQKVALAGNQLTELPSEMANCRNLELLRISANKMTAFPDLLLQLPKLAWLAFSGNPFSHVPRNVGEPEILDWNEFKILEILGQGASGDIYKASSKNNAPHNKEVAIKVFKGEVTSDGFPEDEMLASMAAGIHPNLVTLLGKVKNHPQHKKGIVMSLIPPSFTNLGMPPSLESCSRDTFKPGTSFTSGDILKIARAVASIAKHLHALGINHGDLYAHNTLITKEADTLIGDFGAASFYDTDTVNAVKIEKIESRALGCLLDDLLTFVTEDETDLTKKLTDFKNELMQESVELRPTFKEIYLHLDNF